MRSGIWTIVRTVAELQILTRASYLMLFLVPLIAGIWTTVGNSLPEGNFASAFLPISWVYLYFASVFAVLGQLIYQIRVPYLIQKYSEMEYIDAKLDEWMKSPDHDELAFKASLVHLDKQDCFALYDMVGAETFSSRFTCQDANIRIEVKKALDAEENTDPTSSGPILSPRTDKQTLVSKVLRRSSTVLYRQQNRQNPVSSLFALAFYTGAVLLIFIVAFSQTLNVLLSAGVI